MIRSANIPSLPGNRNAITRHMGIQMAIKAGFAQEFLARFSVLYRAEDC